MSRPSKAERERGRLEATAYHEAGHAIMMILFGRAVRRVTINPDHQRSFLGRVLRHPRRSFQPDGFTLDDTRQKNRVEREILMLLAGPAAEAHFTGHWNKVGALSDLECAHEIAVRSCGGPQEPELFVAWLEARARYLVGRPLTWRQIEALARALLKTPTLSGQECEQICQSAIADLDDELARRHGPINPDLGQVR